MKFYFIHEKGGWTALSAPTLLEQYEIVKKLAKNESRSTGFLGAIDDTGRIRGTLMLRYHSKNFRTQLFNFLRKYHAVEVLEKLAKELQSQR